MTFQYDYRLYFMTFQYNYAVFFTTFQCNPGRKFMTFQKPVVLVKSGGHKMVDTKNVFCDIAFSFVDTGSIFCVFSFTEVDTMDAALPITRFLCPSFFGFG